MQPTQNTASLAEPTRPAGRPAPINVAVTLRAAASYIDRHGWTQKALYEVHGPDRLGARAVCLSGRCDRHGHLRVPGRCTGNTDR